MQETQDESEQHQQLLQQEEESDSNQGKVYDYDARIPIYALSFSNRITQDRNREQSILMGVGSFLPNFNKVQILRMSESQGMKKELEISEPWPATKILWMPKPDDTFPVHKDLLATSSDYLRLYMLDRDEESGCFEQGEEVVPLINRSDFCQPITSFDWNRFDHNTIASASLDSSVTIWDIQTQQIQTQLVAHDKAVYDICFSLDKTVFATVGEDGSVRLFDTRELRNSNIVYEMESKVGLTHVKWNHVDGNIMAVLAQDDTNVLLFDKRRPNTIVDTLCHDSKVSAIAWSPIDRNMLCSVCEGGKALIWDLSEPPSSAKSEAGGEGENEDRSWSHHRQERRDPKSEYKTESRMFNVVWSMADPTWVSVSFDERLQTLRT